MGLFGICWDALKWGFSTNFSHIGRWLLLTLLHIPVICFIPQGTLMKILKGEEPDIVLALKTLLNGFLLFLILFIYGIVPVLLIKMIPGIGWIIGIILAILFCLILIPAEINYARSGRFGKAFAFGEIFGMISNVGWGRYILAFIVMIIFAVLVGIVLGGISFLLTLIPVAGIVLASIFGLLTLIPLICWVFKYWNNVFA